MAPQPSVPQPTFRARDTHDRTIDFTADPFLVADHGTFYLFMEAFRTFLFPWQRRGDIGVASSPDGIRWHWEGVVLSQPFHLSYPCVFKWRGDYYMTPECEASGTVRLYKANPFPRKWELAGVLLTGVRLVDPTTFEHGGHWWLMAYDESANQVHLYMAASPYGPWSEHPRSPIVSGDVRIARGAGLPVEVHGRLYRFAQDGTGGYGAGVRVLQITRLTPTEYAEREAPEGPLLRASGHGWNGLGMHQLSLVPLGPDRFLAAVDGKSRRREHFAQRAAPPTGPAIATAPGTPASPRPPSR